MYTRWEAPARDAARTRFRALSSSPLELPAQVGDRGRRDFLERGDDDRLVDLYARCLAVYYAPVDEDHYPVPTSTYALSKVASETIAGHIAQWSGLPYIALRFSNIMAPDDYQMFPTFWDDPHARKWNLWGYIDQRDVAASCRLALEAPADVVGGEVFTGLGMYVA